MATAVNTLRERFLSADAKKLPTSALVAVIAKVAYRIERHGSVNAYGGAELSSLYDRWCAELDRRIPVPREEDGPRNDHP